MGDVRLLRPRACVLGRIPGFFKLHPHFHIPPALLCISVPRMDEATEGRACEVEELGRLREDIPFHSAHRKMNWWEMTEGEMENVSRIYGEGCLHSLCFLGPK